MVGWLFRRSHVECDERYFEIDPLLDWKPVEIAGQGLLACISSCPKHDLRKIAHIFKVWALSAKVFPYHLNVLPSY